METRRIAALLEPFLARRPDLPSLTRAQLEQISIYIDLLLRWNARINLTAVRDPDQIVTRHFGESLFAARHLFSGPASGFLAGPILAGRDEDISAGEPVPMVVDLGSGAGFPGLPLKVWSPHTRVMLIESNRKKVAFLREVIRSLTLTNIDVFAGRAQTFPPASAALVALRAVERFEQTLAVAVRLLARGGRLALLIGRAQSVRVHRLAPTLAWSEAVPIPLSDARILLTGSVPPPPESSAH
jgi:16S rRNA (guanine527-N7)-methyltransferase